MTKNSVRSWLILVTAVVALVIAYTLAGFFGVPWVVRSQLLSFVSEHYGRQASLGEVRFNPFTFLLDARDFALPDTDGQTLLAFGRLRVDLDVATLWRAAPSFTAIEIERPFVRTLIRRDSTVNLADLAKPFQTSAPPSTEKQKPTRLFIDRFRVSTGEITFEDRSRASPFQVKLEPISFELVDFSTTEKTGNVYALRGASSSGEKFSWDGTFSLQPLASRGRFEIVDLQARTIWSYLRDALPFELTSGSIGLAGGYDFTAEQALGLNVDVHNAAVTALSIRPKGGAADYIQQTNVQIEKTHLSLARERVEVGKISLTGGTVKAWRDAQGGINLLELMPPATPAAPTSATESTGNASTPAASTAPERESSPAPTPSAWVFAAPDIAVEGLSVELEDRLVKPTAAFTLAPININVRGYSTAPDSAPQIEAQIGINGASQLSARATTSLASGAVSGHVDLAAFDLASLQPYINTYTQMTLLSGLLSTGLDIERAANGELAIKGNTEVTKLRTIDNALRQDFIKWDELRLAGVEYKSQPASLRIASISARAPYARLIIAPDQSLNITKVLQPAAGNTPPAVQSVQTRSGETRAPGGNPAQMQVSIGTVKVTNGAANFADFWIQPNYAVSIQGMNGTIVGLSSDPKSRAKVALAGKVDRYAPAQINGEMNLLSAALFTNMKVSFKGVEMTSVTPYSGRFAGYKIEKGKLSIDVSYQVENRKLNAEQRFVIDQLQLGERVDSADAVRLPLRLAIALLKDRNGVIDLNLPMTGSLDDPKFRIGPIIWKAIVGLLTKVATAPFALLGSLFGGGEEMNLIEFEPGVATLDPAAQERVASLVKALKERPQLQLDVPMSYSTELDGAVLATQKLNEKIQALGEQQAAEKKRGKPQDFPVTEPVTEKEFEQLAQARAHAVQDALLASGEIDAGRVFILGATATEPSAGKVRLELSLK